MGDDFRALDDREPLDVDALLTQIPAERRARTYSLHFIRSRLAREGHDVATIDEVAATGEMPLVRFLAASAACARILAGADPIRTGLRRLGALQVKASAKSPAARALSSFVPPSPQARLRFVPHAIRLAGPHIEVRIVPDGDTRCLYQVDALHGFRDVLVGVIETVLIACHAPPSLHVRGTSETRFDLDIRWAPKPIEVNESSERFVL